MFEDPQDQHRGDDPALSRSQQETIAGDLPAAETRPGAHRSHPARIGPFRILSLIGQGGMGVVYEAEQEKPHRRVALKIVQPGLVPASVLRRFELEYEFLGRLQHPGIAQVYQAGIAQTEYGEQPYFAMELVRGVRLDEYVRVRRPSFRDRLALVASIADAVQHAHQRGIIHRDLKPANILVTEAGEPKVLDFGLARAAQDDVMASMRTVAGEVLGTVAYMSPEQVAGDIAALDTRSDVYALGVILYEVIAERLPYELGRTSFPEAARIIHDTEPTRLSLATRRVPPDVETIVAKALEKDKERRYGSAADFAEDIRRFLRDEPITARPASTAYQVRKFARRHKALVAAVVASLVVLIGGVIATSWQAIRAVRAERVAEGRAREAEVEKAKAEAVTAFVTETLASVDPSQAQGRDVSVRDALDAAARKIDAGAMADQPDVEIAVRNAIGTTYGNLGFFDAGERQLRAAIALHAHAGASAVVRADSMARLVDVLYAAGKYAEAEPLGREALKLRREALGPMHVEVADSLDDLGSILVGKGDLASAEPMLREALTIRRTLLPADDPQLALSLNNVAFVIWRKGNLQEAESMYREALSIGRRTLGNQHPEIPSRLINLAVLSLDLGQPDDAAAFAREALAIRRRILEKDHPAMSNALDVLAGALETFGANAEAEVLMREALDIAVRKYGAVHIDTARVQNNLAWLLWKQGKYRQAMPLSRAAVASMPKVYGVEHRLNRAALAVLASNLNGLGNARAAEAAARESLALYHQAPTDQSVWRALLALSHALLEQRRYAEAEAPAREALALGEKSPPVRFPWLKAESQSTLGTALAGQGNATEAESLLLTGYEGLRKLSATPPPLVRAAIERLVSFYSAAGRTEDAASWRTRLREFEAARPN